MSFEFESLCLKHLPKLRSFKCGNPSMEGFLFEEAYVHHINGEGITTVVTAEGSDEIIAYFTLKCDSMKIEDPDMFPEPRFIPCIEIARIAVKTQWQEGKKGIHVGTYLMGFIITLIKEDIATKTGCRFITLHAVQDKVDWYENNFNFKKRIDEKGLSEFVETEYMSLDITDETLKEEYFAYLGNP